MPVLTVFAPPGRQPPAEPKPVNPYREQAVVSCAPLGYWTEPAVGTAPSYRHRLGLHADLDYHDQDSETASVLVSGDAVAALLDCLRGQKVDGHVFSVIGPMPDGTITSRSSAPAQAPGGGCTPNPTAGTTWPPPASPCIRCPPTAVTASPHEPLSHTPKRTRSCEPLLEVT
jgi:hypothetical protein